MQRASLYKLAGLVALALVVVGLALFRRHLKKSVLASKAFRKITWLVGSFVRQVRSQLYMLWWSVSLPVRRKILGSAFLVLTGASLWFVVGGVLAVFHEELLGQSVPLVLKVLIVGLEVALAWHHVKGWIHQGERWAFASVLRLLLREISSLPESPTGAQKEEIVGKIIKALHSVFHDAVKGLTINVMVLGPDNRLRIPDSYWYPPEAKVTYSSDFSLEAGQGGAGTALQKGFLVYMPAIKYEHGISVWLPGTMRPNGQVVAQREYDLLEGVYVSTNPEPYKCILSIPASISGPKAVLNLNSEERDAFGERHFDMLDIGASLIGMVLDK